LVNVYIATKNGDFPTKNGDIVDFPIQNGDLPIKNGDIVDLPIKNGNFP